MTRSSDASASQANAVRRLPSFFTYLGYFVFSFLIAAVLLEIAGRAGLALWLHFHKPTIADMVPGNPAYAAFPWSEQCMTEQAAGNKYRHAYFPFRIWGISESHGNCLNDDATELGVVRRTINPANPACSDHPKIEIWVFGGSTVYGTLIPDWATLPSALSEALNSSSRCVEVRNLGVESYNTNQELILLEEQLKAGHVPKVVVFYDGFNDVNAAFSPGGTQAHLGYVTTKRRLEGGVGSQIDFIRQHSSIWRFAQELRKASAKEVTDEYSKPRQERVALALDNYEQNLRIARKLGELYGFKVCAFWQPMMLYGSKPLAPYENDLFSHEWGPGLPRQGFVPVYLEAEHRAQNNRQFIFLGHAFDSVAQPVYLDWVHLSPSGNKQVAQAMAQHMGECLE